MITFIGFFSLQFNTTAHAYISGEVSAISGTSSGSSSAVGVERHDGSQSNVDADSGCMDKSATTSNQAKRRTSAQEFAKLQKHDSGDLSKMSINDKIAQMAQIDIHMIVHEQLLLSTPKIQNNHSILSVLKHDKIEYYFGKIGVGSLLVTPFTNQYFTASQYRTIVRVIQNTTQSYNRPPVLFGIDSVHGANYIKNAIMTPQQLNIASTFNTTNAYEAGIMASRDSRRAGISWIFSPILGLGIESLWARMYETFGEDPLLVGEMGKAMVTGIQQQDEEVDNFIVPRKSAACAKHFIGYSAPRTGHDRSPSWIPRRHLYQYFLKPWKAVLSKNKEEKEQNGIAMTVMESYTEYDGVPNVANHESLYKILRQQLEFDGVLVTDFEELKNLVSWHKTSGDIVEAVKMTLVDGTVDINMTPFDYNDWLDSVLRTMNIMDSNQITSSSNISTARNEFAPYPSYPNQVKMERIDESVRRILELKEDLNLFDEIITKDNGNVQGIGSPQDRDVAKEMAKESIVLTKNDNYALPIANENVRVHITGPTSDSVAYQSGGWTIQWQGNENDDAFSYGTTILDAAQIGNEWEVSFSCGVDILGYECQVGLNKNLHQVADADYVIICVGEEAYTEKPGDVRNLELPSGQIKFVKKIREVNKTGKLILVYFGGRPRLLKDMVQSVDAVLISFLPGPDGGQAVVDILSGKYNPSARLPITYPKYSDKGGVPYWHAVTDMCTGPQLDGLPLPHHQYLKCDVEWSFGHGLSYTQFSHELRVSDNKLVLQHNLQFKDYIEVSVKVQNIGGRSGSETVMLFLFVENRYVTPEDKLLFYFEKIHMVAGEEKEIMTKLSIDDLRHIGPHDDTHFVIQPGMKVKIGVGPEADCRMNSALCSESIDVVLNDGEQYNPSCEIACDLWQASGCGGHKEQMSSKQCWKKCLSDTNPSKGIQEQGW